MKIFLNDPDEQLHQYFCKHNISESYDSFVIYKNIKTLMNDILLDRPKFIITEDKFLSETELERIVEICCLHEIPIMLLTENLDTIKNIHPEYSSHFVYPTLKLDYREIQRIYGLIRPKMNFVNILDERLQRFSQRRLPAFLKVIILFLFIEPFIKILYLWMMTQFPFDKVINNVFQIPMGIEFFQFWLLFPLSGLLLLFFRKIFFLVFFAIQIYSLFSHITYQKFTWPYVSETPHVSSVLLLVINVILILYLIQSDEKKRFVDLTKVWWRKQKRYETDHDCFIRDKQGQSVPVKIKNVSKAGAFLETKDLNLGEQYQLDFNQNDLVIDIVVMNKRADGVTRGFGVQFANLNHSKRAKLKAFF